MTIKYDCTIILSITETFFIVLKSRNGGKIVGSTKKRRITKFDHQSIRTSLIQSHMYLVVILVFIIFASFFVINKAKSQINSFNDETLVAVNNTEGARRELIVAEKSIYKICLTKNEALNQTYYKEWSLSRENFMNYFNVLKEFSKNGDPKDRIQKIEQMLSDIEKLESAAIDLGMQNQTEKAVETLESGYVDIVNQISNTLLEIAEETTDYMNSMIKKLYQLINIFNGLLIFSLVFSVGLALLSSKATVEGIVEPVKELEEAMEQFKKGNMEFELDYHSDNELGYLAHSVRNSRLELQKYIKNISQTLQKLANKDFTVEVDIEYVGDFSNIKESLVHIISILNNITSSIKSTSEGVSNGTKDVALIAGQLADGSAEQSSTIEELTAAISNISDQSNENTKSAQIVSSKSIEAKEIIDKSNTYMKELVHSMDEIQHSSQEISNIISVINNISGQTNILALNASIEAARAGEAGKGFMVVANQIGELAKNTSDATKMTSDLIYASLQAVNKGVSITQEADMMLSQVVEVTNTIKQLADNVSEASTQQTNSLYGVNSAVEQISRVVQANASISAETASSAVTLENYASNLTALLDEFVLEK